MSNADTLAEPDYLVAESGLMMLNDEGRAVEQAWRAAEKAYDSLRQCWAGAYLAGLFQRNPWLQYLRITLTASAEYNDQGGTYRSINAAVMQILPVPGVALPQSLVHEGVFDDIGAIGLIAEELEDNGCDLYAAFNGARDDYDDLVLNVSRSAIADLLQGGPISGAAAYRALFVQSTGSAIGT